MKYFRLSPLNFFGTIKASSIILLGLVMVIAGSIRIQAEDVTLQEALAEALVKSPELRTERKSVEDLERNLAEIEARAGWQFDLSASYDRGERSVSSGNEVIAPDDNLSEFENISLGAAGSRAFLSGFRINSELNLSDKEPFALEDLQEDWELQVGFNYRLWPRTNSEMARNYQQVKDNLQLARLQLDQAKSELYLQLIGDYAEIYYLQQQRQISEQQLKLADTGYEQVQKQVELKEAGEIDLAEARLSRRQAERNLRNIKRNITTLKDEFARKLGIEDTLEYGKHQQIFAQIKTDARSNGAGLTAKLDDYWEKRADLIVERQANSLEHSRLLLDLAQAEADLEIFEQESGLEVNINGSSELNQGSWQVGISLDYPLYDGGSDQLEEESLQAEIKNINQDIADLEFALEMELENELKGLITRYGELEDAGINEEISHLNFLRQEEAKARGAVDSLELENARLDYETNSINYEQEQLELMLSLLEFERKISNWNLEETDND
ncbi:MAG: TolC family protein [Bacillota bacterium]